MVQYTNAKIVKVTERDDIQKALDVRIAVFVHEQGYEPHTEVDSHDDTCDHWIAVCDIDDGQLQKEVPVGAIRLIAKPDQVAKLGRLAVLSHARGLSLGKRLVQEFIKYSKENGYKTIVLHAQIDKRGFYEKLGFSTEAGDDDVFDEDGTPHIRMWMRNLN
ncbi:acyl-CoA N-acyltransferase [Backusella circina FSU 941]|nr:acyl-CoA N-acyltransferase [Backusella circina FSU 941]